jgi:hypothetical protein
MYSGCSVVVQAVSVAQSALDEASALKDHIIEATKETLKGPAATDEAAAAAEAEAPTEGAGAAGAEGRVLPEADRTEVEPRPVEKESEAFWEAAGEEEPVAEEGPKDRVGAEDEGTSKQEAEPFWSPAGEAGEERPTEEAQPGRGVQGSIQRQGEMDKAFWGEAGADQAGARGGETARKESAKDTQPGRDWKEGIMRTGKEAIRGFEDVALDVKEEVKVRLQTSAEAGFRMMSDLAPFLVRLPSRTSGGRPRRARAGRAQAARRSHLVASVSSGCSAA